MNRKDYIDKIIKFNSIFVQEVKSYTAINNYDINIHAENALIPILNTIYGIELINENEKKRNYPAVDLVDTKNRVAFQITSTTSTDKIISTLQQFFENDLDKKFDALYFYILTEKGNSISEHKIAGAIKTGFEFNQTEHILDATDIIKKINYIQPIDRLAAITRIFEHEFSDIQVRSRERKYKDGYLKTEPEDVYLNLLDISFPSKLYCAELNIDTESLKQQLNEYREKKGWKKRNKFELNELLKQNLHNIEGYSTDWILRENKIITFKKLRNTKEPFARCVDKGTVEEFDSEDYYSTSVDYLNNFKDLLNKNLLELCKTKGIEWLHDRKIFRFKNNLDVPNAKRIRWKGKNEATKTVIFEMISKKKEGEDQHIICYRNMAFHASFHYINNKWHLTINPTWSFTNPGGYKASRFESTYMTGLKRQENNSTVYYQFRFFAYYLSYTDLFSVEYPYLKITPMKPIEFIPKIEDTKWLPPREFTPLNTREGELQVDNELNTSLFK